MCNARTTARVSQGSKHPQRAKAERPAPIAQPFHVRLHFAPLRVVLTFVSEGLRSSAPQRKRLPGRESQAGLSSCLVACHFHERVTEASPFFFGSVQVPEAMAQTQTCGHCRLCFLEEMQLQHEHVPRNWERKRGQKNSLFSPLRRRGFSLQRCERGAALDPSTAFRYGAAAGTVCMRTLRNRAVGLITVLCSRSLPNAWLFRYPSNFSRINIFKRKCPCFC